MVRSWKETTTQRYEVRCVRRMQKWKCETRHITLASDWVPHEHSGPDNEQDTEDGAHLDQPAHKQPLCLLNIAQEHKVVGKRPQRKVRHKCVQARETHVALGVLPAHPGRQL